MAGGGDIPEGSGQALANPNPDTASLPEGPRSAAIDLMACLASNAVIPASMRRAAVPDTWGTAMLVHDSVAWDPPRYEEYTETPWATSSRERPREDQGGTSREAEIAPTATTLG